MRVLYSKFFLLVLLFVFSLWHAGIVQSQEIAIDETPVYAEASQSDTDHSPKKTAKEAGLGMGSVLASVIYSPLKVTYAGLGLLTGGVGYVVSGGRSDVAKSIINPAVRGNYVITPDHLQGKERVIFVGPPPPAAVSPQPVVTAADPATPG